MGSLWKGSFNSFLPESPVPSPFYTSIIPVLLISTVGLQLPPSAHPPGPLDLQTHVHAHTHCVLPVTSAEPAMLSISPKCPLFHSSLFLLEFTLLPAILPQLMILLPVFLQNLSCLLYYRAVVFIFACRFLFIVDNIGHVLHFFPLSPSSHPLPFPQSPAFTTLLLVSMGYAYMHICSLANLFPSPNALPSEICQSVPCIPAFGFISLVYFVHQIPHLSEIIWCLFFSDSLFCLA